MTINLARSSISPAMKYGQAAVGEGDVRAALENLDVGAFINPAGFGGGGSASSHAPDDHDAKRFFINQTPPFVSQHEPQLWA